MLQNDKTHANFQPYVDALKTQQPTADEDAHMQSNLLKSIEAYDSSVAQDDEKVLPWQWLKGLSSKFQLGLAGSCAAAITLSFGLFLYGGGGNPAFAAVVQKLSTISSMYYEGEMVSNGQAIMKLEVFYRAPSKLRIVNTSVSDNSTESLVNVIDTEEGKGLIIFPHLGKAMPFDFEPGSANGETVEQQLIAWHTKILNYDGEVLVTEPTNRNGIDVLGYTIHDDNMDITLWVDVATEWPVNIVVETKSPNGQGSFKFEADIKFNQTLDNELFSLSPANYQLMTPDET